MKRKCIILILAVLMAMIPVGALAYEYDLVLDDANLLTREEWTALNDKAWTLSGECGLEIVILTADNADGKAVRDFAADFYDQYGYGYGDDYDGVMLTLCMAERQNYILTTGSAIDIFTDYGIQRILDDIRPDLSAGDYYSAFDVFLNDAQIFIEQAATGAPFDVDNVYDPDYVPATLSETLSNLLPVLIVLALVFTLIGMMILRRGMKTARPRNNAREYVLSESLNVTWANEIFLYRSQERRKIPREDSSSGGSSTFTSDSGVKHGGGGGSF